MNELISVIIPVYNAEKYIEKCVNSLLTQTYSNFELILVDDGSKDKSFDKCEKLSKEDDRIRLYKRENGGASAARNTGLKHAKGAYIIFVDSDDFVSQNYVENLYFALKDNNLDIVQCVLKSTNKQINDTIKVNYNPHDVKIISKIEALNDRKYKVSVCGKIYARKIFNNFNFIEGIIYEDDASYYIFIDRANRIGLLNESLYYYYMSSNSVMRNDNNEKSIAFIKIYEDRIKYFKDRDEIDLLEGSYDRYCLVLMLNYSASLSKNINLNSRALFLDEFKKYYPKVKNSKCIRKKDKMMYKVFNISPNIVGRIIGKIRK